MRGCRLKSFKEARGCVFLLKISSMYRITVFVCFILFLYSCTEEKKTDASLLQYIPTDTSVIISATSSDDVNALLHENELFNRLEKVQRIQQIRSASGFLTAYDLNDQSLITISPEGKNDLAITLITAPIESQLGDSTHYKPLTYNKVSYVQNAVNNHVYYSLNYNGYHLASSSQLVIESLIRRGDNDMRLFPEFESIYNRTAGNDLGIYIKAHNAVWFKDFLSNTSHRSYASDFGSWYKVSPLETKNALHLDGIITYKDSVNQFHSLFQNIQAQENQAGAIIPATVFSTRSFTYNDVEQLRKNLSKYHSDEVKINATLKSLLENSNEVSRIDLPKNQVLAFTLKPYEQLYTNIDSASIAKFNYRDFTIYELATEINTSDLSPLLPKASYKYFTVIDQFVLLTETSNAPEIIIANYQNKTVLNNQNWWNNATDQLSSSSTLLYYSSPDYLKSSLGEKDKKSASAFNVSDYPIALSQYVHENAYAHYRFLIPSKDEQQNRNQVAQIGTYKSSNNIIAGPFLFPNHKTGSLDVAYQDEDFKLHLLDKNGKPYWDKSLDSKIIGSINAVDGFKNGRKQLLFNTANKVYYLDRNGEDIGKYPLSFKDTITQPLSVFDYDNSRNYRIVVTQNEDLLMYNIKGEKVKGFTYKSSGVISTSPQHFRVNGRDYIALAKADNTISLLHRTGKVRTTVKENVGAQSGLFLHNKAIKLIAENQLISINTATGAITKTAKKIGTDAHYTAKNGIEIIQENNVLQIGKEKVELPYGTYTNAQIVKLKGASFIHLIDNGSNKVYVLDSKGAVLEGFPVYGKQVSDMGYGKGNFLAVKDDQDVIIYKF